LLLAFIPKISKDIVDQVLDSADDPQLIDLVTQPLHEELYKRQDFNFMDELSDAQQLFLSYDYLVNQVGQGGFIQFLVNGYVGLLADMPSWLTSLGANEMAQVIDDVLKVYVLNVDLFNKETTPEEFAKLYDELKEFELLDERFEKTNPNTMHLMAEYVRNHIDKFIDLKAEKAE
jgi:hypothetical protein